MPKKSRRRISRKRKIKKPLVPFSRLFKLSLLPLAVFTIWVVYLDFTVRDKFDGKKWSIPARVYAQPLEIYEGLTLKPKTFENELRSLGYKPVRRLQSPGQFAREAKRYQVYTKGFHFWDKAELPTQYQLEFDGEQVSSLNSADENMILRLEPQEIGSIYPGDGEDRIFSSLDQIPPILGETIIAVEDKHFAHHYGLSLKAIARALWANFQAGGLVQGGSTITQQLVKNFYLTHDRSLWRKIQEAVMSVLLELHYSKAEILEAYINEVYLGQSGPRSIHGFSLGSQHYFNQPLNKLKIHQVALLVGVIKGASYYNPWRYPERALKRRNLVLSLMAQNGLIGQQDALNYQQKSLDISAYSQRQQGDYPAYLDLVKRQLLRDYREQDLQSEGLRIFTTMSPQIQQQTEAAVVRQMKVLNQAAEKTLQAAAIITAVGSGEILALVGDRNPQFSGFNRALDARRQIGSLVKPFVYLTALRQSGLYQLSSVLDDSPVELVLANGDLWQPKNFSRESHGELLLYQALAFSYNQSTARLGLEVGVDQVIATLKRAGLEQTVDSFPALLLGALNLSPLEVSHLYHTLAADGVYTPLRAIRSVLNANNQPLQRYALESEPRFTPEESHLMHYALQTVMRVGTGRRAYWSLPPELAVAGKTGTSNEQRDSWFAGYSGDHLGVIWIGNDNNLATQLTGSSGALKVWTDIFTQLETQGIVQETPSNIEYYWIDTADGLRSAKACGGAQLVPFIKGTQPLQTTNCALANRTGLLDRWLN